MSKLTSTQVAAKLYVNPYTVKRWYEFYRDLTEEEIAELEEKYDMPRLPQYIEIGTRRDRIWDEEDIPALEKFRDWVPPRRLGVFQKYKKED